jgi:hypothetical protein
VIASSVIASSVIASSVIERSLTAPLVIEAISSLGAYSSRTSARIAAWGTTRYRSPSKVISTAAFLKKSA